MTLTYRGQKYEQQEVAATFNKPALTCRGDSYAKSSRLNQDIHNPRLLRGVLFALIT